MHPLGGNKVVIFGTGFASRSIDNAVIFDDGTLCEIKSDYEVTTKLRCKTQKFDKTVLKTDYSLKVTANGVSEKIYVTLSNPPTYANSISPNNVSPVLESELTIQLSDYPHDLVQDDFKAELNLVSEPSTGHWIWFSETSEFKWVTDEKTTW